MSRIAAVSIAGLLALLPSVAWAQSSAESRPAGVYERDVVDVAPTAPVTLLAVDNRLGEVVIQGHDSDKVVISAHKRALDQETLERLKVTLVPDESGAVRIATSLTAGREARPVPGGSVAIDLVILAPRSARVDARVWNERLAIAGMENGAELRSNTGAIDVKNASGAIVTHSAGGEQRFLEVFGTVDAQSIAGGMDLDIVRGRRLDASVHDGHIDGREVRVSEMSLRSTRGNIRLRAQAVAGGHYQVGTLSGDIEVEFGSSAPLAVRARSRKGRVSLPEALAARTQDLGQFVGERPGDGAQAVIELRSRVGNIQFALVD